MKKTVKNKGFTLVELVVVIAVIMAAVTVSAGPIVGVYKARAKAAASEISAMISQSKIEALSGRKNTFILEYGPGNNGKNVYKCTIHYDRNSADEVNKNYNNIALESNSGEKQYAEKNDKYMEVGNDNLDIYFGNSSKDVSSLSSADVSGLTSSDSSVKDARKLEIRYNSQTGAIDKITLGTGEGNVKYDKVNSITPYDAFHILVVSNRSLIVNLFAITGEQEVEPVG